MITYGFSYVYHFTKMLNRKIIHIHTKGGIVMTRKYLITKLIKNYFDSIVTLLDYDTQMTNQLKKITILSKKNGKVLIDAFCIRD